MISTFTYEYACENVRRVYTLHTIYTPKYKTIIFPNSTSEKLQVT